jgi:hypothetical protein
LKKNGAQSVQIVLRRGRVDQTVTVQPVIACSIPIDFVTADEVNAYTTGDKIFYLHPVPTQYLSSSGNGL